MVTTRYLNAKNGIEILHDGGTTQILAGELDPISAAVEANVGSIYLCSGVSGTIYKKFNSQPDGWIPDYDFQLLKTYISLLDTPTTYSGSAGKYPRVKDDETGLEFDFIEWVGDDPESPLIPDTAVSGTYYVNFEGGRLLVGATGNKPDLVYIGPIGGLAFASGKSESCYGSFKIPSSWNTDSSIKLTINFMNDLDQSGSTSCSWRLEYQSYAPGDTYTNKSSSTANITVDLLPNSVAGTFYTNTIIMLPDDINNPLEREDIVVFRLYRDGALLEDTMIGDAVLITLMIELQTGQHIIGDI